MIIHEDLTEETFKIIASLKTQPTTVWITFGLGTPESIVVEVFQSKKHNIYFACEGIVNDIKKIILLDKIFKVLSNNNVTFMVDFKVFELFKKNILTKTFYHNVILFGAIQNFLSLNISNNNVVDYHSLFLTNNFQQSFEKQYSDYLEEFKKSNEFWGVLHIKAIQKAILNQGTNLNKLNISQKNVY